MDILGHEFRLIFTSPLWIVHWKSKALQKRLSNQYTCITVIVSCFRRCYKSSSLRKRWNRKIHKLQLFANKFLHCVRVGIWKLVIRVTVDTNGLFGDNIQKLKIAWLRQDFPKQNHVIEMSLSDRISVELLLPCYACRLFLWTIAFPNHTHVISLLPVSYTHLTLPTKRIV